MTDFTLSGPEFKSHNLSAGMLEWAINYAQCGIPVFPLIGKKPVPESNGFHDATTDLDQIEKWWRQYPNANVGIPTGNASGFWVLDIDGQDGQRSLAELQDEYDTLNTPVISLTARGQHLLFKMNGRDIRNRAGIRPGVDVRGNGGYIVAPPSVHPDGPSYAWIDHNPTTMALPYAPDWICDLIEKKAAPQTDTQVDLPVRFDHESSYIRKAVDDEVRAVATAGKGTRNDALNRAAFNLGQFVGAKVLQQSEVERLLVGAATQSGLVTEDGEAVVRKTIASGLSNGIANPRQMPEPKTTSGNKAKWAYASKKATENNVALAASPANGTQIQIVAGELPRIVDDAEAALIKNDAPVYQRGSMLVTIGRTIIKTRDEDTIGPRIIPLAKAGMVEHMTKAADWRRWDGRSEAWMPTDCPAKVAETYLARGDWKVRALAGIIEAPTMRWDGSILSEPGYDRTTGLMLIGKVDMQPVLEHPTEQDAREALEILKEPIKSFPFATDADRSVALSGVLTTITRRAYKSAPLHAFTAPTAGSGKGKLVDMISVIATGRPASTTPPGKTEEEAEKRLGSALIGGDPLITIDNLDQPLGGELLCQCLTQPTMKIRILGQSLNVEVPSIATMFATGNNMAIMGDMTRRTVVCRIDPQCERPELREFDFDPIEMVGKDRGRYIRAALTILRAYVMAGFSNKQKPLGSFEEWSNHVRSALVWLGEADPVATMDGARESDPVLTNLRAIIAGWSDVIGEHEQVTASKLVTHANKMVQGNFGSPAEFAHEELREALLSIAGAGGTISTKSLGRWLKSNAGRVVNGYRIVLAQADAHNGARYRLENVNKANNRF